MSRTRTFIAVHLDDAIRDNLVDLQEELSRSGAEVKWTEPENLHVTLLFLGEVNDEEIPKICRLVSDAVRGVEPFQLVVGGTGCFPNPRRPRVLWVGVKAGSQPLIEIHDRMEVPLFDLGYRTEDRKYTPHITLGRVRKDSPSPPRGRAITNSPSPPRGEGRGEGLAAALTQHAAWEAGDMIVKEIHIMGSELKRDGPVYTVLGRAKLG